MDNSYISTEINAAFKYDGFRIEYAKAINGTWHGKEEFKVIVNSNALADNIGKYIIDKFKESQIWNEYSKKIKDWE